MNQAEFLGSNSVSLGEMLAAREHRANKQQELLDRFPGMHLISFSLNIAGPHKVFPLAKNTFMEGCKLLMLRLNRAGIAVSASETEGPKTGETAYFVVGGNARHIKRILCEMEENCPLGRFFDLDLLDCGGRKISRTQLGLPERSCLICKKAAADCGRSRSHSVDELQRHTVEWMQCYFYQQHAEKIASFAVRALLYEVSVTPKPGLVDRMGNGAHKDMDFYTFLDSTSVLASQFRTLCLLGSNHCDTPPRLLFQKARYQGQMAEDMMFDATGGVNTHKGLVFSLGLLCVAAGCLYAKTLRVNKECLDGQELSLASLLQCCSQLGAFALTDLEKQNLTVSSSHGERAFQCYGVLGARGQAATGFRDAVEHALPFLDEEHPNDSGCLALLHLLACVEDTNLLHRNGPDGLHMVQKKAVELLKQAHPNRYINGLEEMNRELVELWASPGGSADLLAVAFFLLFYTNDLRKQDSQTQ